MPKGIALVLVSFQKLHIRRYKCQRAVSHAWFVFVWKHNKTVTSVDINYFMWIIFRDHTGIALREYDSWPGYIYLHMYVCMYVCTALKSTMQRLQQCDQLLSLYSGLPLLPLPLLLSSYLCLYSHKKCWQLYQEYNLNVKLMTFRVCWLVEVGFCFCCCCCFCRGPQRRRITLAAGKMQATKRKCSSLNKFI